jgi:hypothetical protein
MAIRSSFAAAALCAAVAGCATPYSQLVGYRYHRTDIDTYPVTVTRVDDTSYNLLPVLIDPGPHQVTVQAPPAAGFAYGYTRTIMLDVKPCTRYYLVAVKENRLSQDFEVKVDYEEPVAGCKVG